MAIICFQTHPKLTAIKIYQAIQSPGVDLKMTSAQVFETSVTTVDSSPS